VPVFTPPSSHVAKAAAFRGLHHEAHPLLLPNAWDPISAWVIQAGGAKAIATTSAGVAWSRGVADGSGLDASTALDAVARILAAVDVPLSADLERGYHESPSQAAETVAEAIRLGVCGVNIEDSVGGTLVDPADQVDLLGRVAGVVKYSGVPIFINARTDTFLFADPASDVEALVEETVSRGRSYADAGADGLFVPGIADRDVIMRIAMGVPVPINVMVGAAPVAVAEMADLGVRRISWGSQVAQSTFGWLQRQVGELLGSDGGAGMPAGLDFGPTNAALHFGAQA